MCKQNNLLRNLFLLGLVLAGLTAAVPAARVQARDPSRRQTPGTIQVRDNSVVLDYPDLLTFNLQAHSDSPIQTVTLFYGTNAVACQTNQVRKPVDVAVGRDVTASWEIELARFANLPAGAEIFWQWEITDESGAVLTTELMTRVVADDRYDWQTLQQGAITVQWVEGGGDFGRLLLDTANQSLDRLIREAGIAAPEDILLVIYPSAEDVRNAVHYVPDWTGGLAFTEYNVILMGIAPNQEDWLVEVVPHELAHLVTNHVIFNCQGGDMPTWLSEGLSVYAEGPTSSTDSTRVLDALADDSLDTLESLANGFASNAQRAGLAYAQSGMVVHFMIQEYGSEKLGQLFAAIRDGQKIDAALTAAYGVDTYGLDRAWRASLGFSLPERPTATPTPQGQAATPIPTLALWTQAYSAPSATPIPPVQSSPTSLSETATLTPAPTVTTPGPTPTTTPVEPSPAPTPTPVITALILGAVLLGGIVSLIIYRRLKRN
ncbi:MAG TPA: peptidase MA family metallohydrolase [Anaerolineaceae bacterium]|nr:peptidase MA family metallohydrolase [Anaerolineaceae bacterium]